MNMCSNTLKPLIMHLVKMQSDKMRFEFRDLQNHN